MKQISLIIVCLFVLYQSYGQEQLAEDSSVLLKEVIVRGFENNNRLIDVPASINVVRRTDLERGINLSIVQALNTFPGVRMEERSPGSYRLNLRGSSLRSPFGVRNVKVYYNDIPYTDAGGNTYLNVLGFYNVESIEVLKGPGGSLYGAGTGGVLLVRNDVKASDPSAEVSFTTGSFGMKSYAVSTRFGDTSFMQRVSYQQQKADGYREHTALNRKVFTWDTKAKLGNGSMLQSHLLYGDLYYQTPGGLNASEYAKDPRQARPAGAFPSPQQAKAAIYTKLFLAGISYSQYISDAWKFSGSMYGAFSELKNPTIRNYERKTEPNVGGRLMITGSWKTNAGQVNWNTGVEAQQGFGTVRVSVNRNGEPDSIQTDDELRNRQFFVFSQVDITLKKGWYIAAGASVNSSKLEFSRTPGISSSRTFGTELAPRIAISKKLTEDLSLYATVAKGFSPPSNAELLPSTGILSTDLNAESGYNYEAGIKGSLFRNRLYFDINSFYFLSNNTIVVRRDAAGSDYFVNAGSTKQFGVESFFQYRLLDSRSGFIRSMLLYGSYTSSNFSYGDYRKDTVSFEGNKLPSVSPNVVSSGIDLQTKLHVYARLTWYYNDPIPLNDANTAYGSSFNLIGARFGYQKTFARTSLELFAAADNLFDVKYSLGNDINAAGGRYFNAAPGRNFAGGIVVRLK